MRVSTDIEIAEETRKSSPTIAMDGLITCRSCEYRYRRSEGVCVICGTPAPALDPPQPPPVPRPQRKVERARTARFALCAWIRNQLNNQIRAAALVIPAIALVLTTNGDRSPATASAKSAARAPAKLQTPAQAATPALPSSHAQITDGATASALHALSPYETALLERQARYGDDSAAFLLGMAYEIGHGVPQSCAIAALWVTTAAGWGNAAAEYNLALRYRSGDGVAIDQQESRKWLNKSASQNYLSAKRSPISMLQNH